MSISKRGKFNLINSFWNSLNTVGHSIHLSAHFVHRNIMIISNRGMHNIKTKNIQYWNIGRRLVEYLKEKDIRT